METWGDERASESAPGGRSSVQREKTHNKNTKKSGRGGRQKGCGEVVPGLNALARGAAPGAPRAAEPGRERTTTSVVGTVVVLVLVVGELGEFGGGGVVEAGGAVEAADVGLEVVRGQLAPGAELEAFLDERGVHD